MNLRNWSYALFATLALAGFSTLAAAQVSVDVSVNVAPPELPVYDQPPIPGDGYVWTPGYWAWADDVQDYYWVPGTWVEAPQPDYLWTPGYWAADGAVFLFHPGYWGPQVGFYGGVNYGYGYTGNGYQGGYWRGGQMYYNRAVVNVGSTRITNVYNRTVVNNVTVNRVSYNGGRGGISARPTADQEAAARERHVEYTNTQREHQQEASRNQSLRLSQNRGNPAIAATARPGAFTGGGVVAARHGSPTVSTRVDPARTNGQGVQLQQQQQRDIQMRQNEQRGQQPTTAPAGREPSVREPTPRPVATPAPREQREAPTQPRPENRPAPPRENIAPRPQQVEPPHPQPQQQPRAPERPAAPPRPEPQQQPRAQEQRSPPPRPESHPPERPRTPER